MCDKSFYNHQKINTTEEETEAVKIFFSPHQLLPLEICNKMSSLGD